MLIYSVLVVIPFVLTAYGGPLIGRNPMCNVGSLHCCDKLDAQDPGSSTDSTGTMGSTGSGLMDLLNLNLTAPILSHIGTTCTPLSLGGLGSSAGCESSPACCTTAQNNQQGLINFYCNPINLV